jgi:hypothetical protein
MDEIGGGTRQRLTEISGSPAVATGPTQNGRHRIALIFRARAAFLGNHLTELVVNAIGTSHSDGVFHGNLKGIPRICRAM